MEKAIYQRNPQHRKLYRELYAEVLQGLRNLPEGPRKVKRLFAWIMPLAYISLYILAIYVGGDPVLYPLLLSTMGIVSVLMFINLFHDAVHNHVFSKKISNQLYLLLFDLLGGNSYIWKKRHLMLHHNYPNVAGFDADIEQSGPIKIFPHQPGKKIHRYQHLFVFLLYPLFLFNWILLRDFKDFFSTNRAIRQFIHIPGKEYLKLIVFKGIFLSYIFLIPVLTGVPVLRALGGIAGLMITGSIVAMLALLTPHANSANHFPKVSPEGAIPVSWLEHQFRSTNDLSVCNWFSKHVMGNFNYHLAHHLFPQIHSAYAPEVTACIRKFANRNGFPYKEFPLGVCLKLHYKLICQNSEIPNILEEDM